MPVTNLIHSLLCTRRQQGRSPLHNYNTTKYFVINLFPAWLNRMSILTQGAIDITPCHFHYEPHEQATFEVKLQLFHCKMLEGFIHLLVNFCYCSHDYESRKNGSSQNQSRDALGFQATV